MSRLWHALTGAIARLNRWMGYLSGLMIVVSALILTYEVLARYFFRSPSDWALELCILLLIASTFVAAAYTLVARAHVNIEIVDALLSSRANRWRLLLADLLSALLCGFVAVNAWGFFARAWAEGWESNSTWAPKLWIPFGFVALGMTLLAVQYVIQIVEARLVPLFARGGDGRA